MAKQPAPPNLRPPAAPQKLEAYSGTATKQQTRRRTGAEKQLGRREIGTDRFASQRNDTLVGQIGGPDRLDLAVACQERIILLTVDGLRPLQLLGPVIRGRAGPLLHKLLQLLRDCLPPPER